MKLPACEFYSKYPYFTITGGDAQQQGKMGLLYNRWFLYAESSYRYYQAVKCSTICIRSVSVSGIDFIAGAENV